MMKGHQEIKIDTGNLLSCDSFKRKVILIPAVEVIEGVKLTLDEFVRRRQSVDCTPPKELWTSPDSPATIIIDNPHLTHKIDPLTRSGLKVSVKVFTYTKSCSVFTDAINSLMSSLGIDCIDSLTLSLPPALQGRAGGIIPGGSIEEMKAIWACAVKNALNGKIKDLGVSDLDASQLRQLYDWAEEIKPSVNQVNLDACCVIPPELQSFAKETNIRLLTHNDPRDMLPKETVDGLLSNHSSHSEGGSSLILPSGSSATDWSCLWVARYSILVTGNGVIEGKGFLVSLVRKIVDGV